MFNFKTLSLTLVAAPLLLGACAQTGPEVRPSGQLVASPTGEQEGEPNHARGKSHFLAGRYGLSVEAFRQAVENDGGSIKSLNGLAASYDQIGRFDLAERYYRQALALDPSSVQSLNNLGYSYLLQGKHDLAYAYLREAQILAEDDATVRANNQAAELALQGQGIAARQVLEPDEIAVAAKPSKVTVRSKIWIERTDAEVQTLRIAGDDIQIGLDQVFSKPLMVEELTVTPLVAQAIVEDVAAIRHPEVVAAPITSVQVAALVDLPDEMPSHQPKPAPISLINHLGQRDSLDQEALAWEIEHSLTSEPTVKATVSTEHFAALRSTAPTSPAGDLVVASLQAFLLDDSEPQVNLATAPASLEPVVFELDTSDWLSEQNSLAALLPIDAPTITVKERTMLDASPSDDVWYDFDLQYDLPGGRHPEVSI